jgi:hypothetical protein
MLGNASMCDHFGFDHVLPALCLPADESDLTTRMEVIVTLFLALTGISQ